MSLDSIPTLPRALNVSGDDLIGIIDMADRRSPKSVTVADAVASSVNDAIADNPSDTIEALGVSPQLYRTPLTVACVGTSITHQGTVLTTDVNPRIHDLTNGHAGWLEPLSNHRVRLARRNGVFEAYTDKTFGYPGYQLPGLTDGSTGVYPLDNAIASGAEVLVLEGGTNDVNTGLTDTSTTVSRVTSYWTKAVNSGKQVIALNILPIGSASGATKRDIITNANAQLVSVAASLGVTLIDSHSVATKDGNGYATDETLWDGIHPTPAYAHRLAKLIDTQLATYYADRPQSMIVPSAASSIWITQSNSPSQATIPTGWAKSGTFTDTYTAVTDADGTTWQRVKMVQGGAAKSVNSLYIRATSGFSAGDRVRFAVRMREVSGATFDANEFYAYGRTTANYSAWQYAYALSGGTNLGTGDYDPITGLFISPVLTVPSGTVAIDAAILFNPNTEVSVDVRQFGVFKVVENL